MHTFTLPLENLKLQLVLNIKYFMKIEESRVLFLADDYRNLITMPVKSEELENFIPRKLCHLEGFFSFFLQNEEIHLWEI